MGVNWGLLTPQSAKALVRVGPVGLEPTTYGLKIWLLAQTSVTCHRLAEFPTVKGEMKSQIALS
jgi:hypothetical protein